jgi:hypothetical protein
LRDAVLDPAGFLMTLIPEDRHHIGPRMLELLVEDHSGMLHGLSIAIRGRRRGQREARCGPESCGARIARSREGHSISVPWAGMRSIARAFVKLDRPFERRLGLLADEGWREIPLVAAAAPRDREAEETWAIPASGALPFVL